MTGAPAAAMLLGPAHAALRGRTGRGVDVVVIDSGVNPGHPHLGEVAESVAFGDDGAPRGDAVDRLGHGTAVAAAIHEKAPDARLRVVQVFHHTLSTTVAALVRAIDWAAEREARLVNLSLGTPRPEHAPALADAVERARSRGAIVVSARGHAGRPWYPGSLGGVVAVELDPACPRDAARFSAGGDGAVAAWASPYPRPIPGVPPERNLHGVSFAVANATGVLACLLEAHPDLRAAADLAALLR